LRTAETAGRAATSSFTLYEGQGRDEAKILGQVSKMDGTVVALARAIFEPEPLPREPYSVRPTRPRRFLPN